MDDGELLIHFNCRIRLTRGRHFVFCSNQSDAAVENLPILLYPAIRHLNFERQTVARRHQPHIMR